MYSWSKLTFWLSVFLIKFRLDKTLVGNLLKCPGVPKHLTHLGGFQISSLPNVKSIQNRRLNFRICIVFTRFYRQNTGKMYIFSLKMKFDRRQRTNPTKIEFVLFDSAHLFAIGKIKTSLTQPLACVKSKQKQTCFCQICQNLNF